MTFHKKNRAGQKGFSLVETLVGSAIFVVIALSAFRAFAVLMEAVSVSQAKLSATTLANEKFEIMRNLPYTDVGIIAGLPVGKIQRNETIVRDGYSFDLETSIRSVDDPFDGIIGGSPSDTSPADYKSADLDITCTNCKQFSPLSFTTLVAPHALETASTNGALFIQVFDASGIPIANASVHIVNTQTNPDTIIDETTDNTGWVKIVDAPPGTNAYNITATKSGYTMDQTYPLGGGAGANPVSPDSTVVIHLVTQTSFSIDRTSSLNIGTVDSLCAALPAINLSLTGTKIIGTPAILKYPAQNFATDATGHLAIPDLERDTYAINLASYDLAGSTPFPSFDLSPNENISLQLVAVPHVDRALLVSVQDSGGVVIDGASIQLEGAFNGTKITNSGALCATPGQVFWNGLPSGIYTLTVSSPGYQDSVTSVDMSPSWQNKTIILTP